MTGETNDVVRVDRLEDRRGRISSALGQSRFKLSVRWLITAEITATVSAYILSSCPRRLGKTKR